MTSSHYAIWGTLKFLSVATNGGLKLIAVVFWNEYCSPNTNMAIR